MCLYSDAVNNQRQLDGSGCQPESATGAGGSDAVTSHRLLVSGSRNLVPGRT